MLQSVLSYGGITRSFEDHPSTHNLEDILDSSTQSLLLLGIFPLVVLILMGANLLVRARGGRSFKLSLKGLGMEVRFESTNNSAQKGEDGGS